MGPGPGGAPGGAPGPGPMGPGPGGPGPGPFPGPGFGPRGPWRPPMHPMGPDFMGGPGRPQEPGGGDMYGVSSGEAHKSVETDDKEKEPEDDTPKAIYSSAPQIVVPLQKKEKKRKRKKKDKSADSNSETANSAKSSVDSSITAANVPEIPVEVTSVKPEHMEDFQVADMEIEPVVPVKKEKKEKKKKFIRFAAGQAWEDTTLAEWDQGLCNLISVLLMLVRIESCHDKPAYAIWEQQTSLHTCAI